MMITRSALKYSTVIVRLIHHVTGVVSVKHVERKYIPPFQLESAVEACIKVSDCRALKRSVENREALVIYYPIHPCCNHQDTLSMYSRTAHFHVIILRRTTTQAVW